MLRTLGRPMGLQFDTAAVDYLVKQYGGHPLLTRIACSITHRSLREAGDELPRVVGEEWLRQTEADRDAELSFYCGHVVSELSQFYPDEYEILTEIACGNWVDIYEFVTDPHSTTHLNNYGLLKTSNTGRPAISMPVLEGYVRLQAARNSGTKTISAIQPTQKRERWLRSRKQSINDNLDQLQEAIAKLDRPSLYGTSSYPESHKFFELTVVKNETDFATLIPS